MKSSNSIGEKLFYALENDEFILSPEDLDVEKTDKESLSKVPSLIKIGKALASFLVDDEKAFYKLKRLWDISHSNLESLSFSLMSGREFRLIVIGALEKLLKKRFSEVGDFVISVSSEIRDWETCDQLALKVVATLLSDDRERFSKFLKNWTESQNKWERRLAVATIPPYIRKNPDEVNFVLSVLGSLMMEKDKDVKKAISWALREVSKKDEETVYDFLKDWLDRGNEDTRRIIKDGMKKLSKDKQDKLKSYL